MARSRPKACCGDGSSVGLKCLPTRAFVLAALLAVLLWRALSAPVWRALSVPAEPPLGGSLAAAALLRAAAASEAGPRGAAHASLLLSRRLHAAAAGGGGAGSFSSYKCLGGHDRASAASERSCVFRNVCHVNGSGLRLRFYADPREPQQPVTSEGGDISYGFGESFVAAGPYLHSGYSKAWSPELVLAPRPEGFATHPAAVAVALESFLESNFGEFVNVLVNVFGQPALHGLQPRANDTVLLELDPWQRSGKFRAAMLPSVSAHAPVDLRAAGDVCFRNVVVGAGRMSVLELAKWGAFVVEPLRDAILEGMAIYPPPPPERHSIVVLQKSAASSNPGRHVLNHDAVVADLAAHFAGVADVSSLLPDGLGVREQLERAQAATVIVTPPGGGSFLALFAQPGAAVIFLDVMHGGQSMRYPQVAGGGLEDATWTHLGSMEKLHFPICAGESPGGDSESNLVVSLPRMRHFVYLAMKRAERNLPSIQEHDTRRDGVDKFRTPNLCNMTEGTEALWQVTAG